DAMGALAEKMSGRGVVFFNPSPFERDGIPGMGWRVNPAPPVEYPGEIAIDGDHFHIGSLRLRLVDEGDVGDLYNFCPTEAQPAATPTGMKIEGDTLVASWPGLKVELTAFV